MAGSTAQRERRPMADISRLWPLQEIVCEHDFRTRLLRNDQPDAARLRHSKRGANGGEEGPRSLQLAAWEPQIGDEAADRSQHQHSDDTPGAHLLHCDAPT